MSEPIEGIAAEIIEEEERVYARVQSRVAMGPGTQRKRVVASDIDGQLIELRDAIAEAKPEDLAPLVEQMTRLAALRGKLGGSRSLPVDVRSPYFAHMRLRENSKERDVLIGKRGFIDRDSNVQIVDWRNAPISQVYYRYEEGDDYEEEIGGRHLIGLVDVRRNISITGGRLRRIGAPQGTFIRDARNTWHQAVGSAAPTLQGGSGKAARVGKAKVRAAKEEHRLSKKKKKGKRGNLGIHHGPVHRADKHMPEIAALIDKEQFDLITQPEEGLLVIQGGAGSGKTTVALHRIAYLNFAAKRRFAAKKILFVVPSPALARYVADVLPALGVHGVRVITYASWARSTRQRVLHGSSGKVNDDTPEPVSRIKKHPALLPLLEQFVADQVEAAGEALAETLTDQVGADLVLGKWDELAKIGLVSRLARLNYWLRTDAKQHLAPVTLNHAQGLVRTLLTRSDDILTDWADLLTDIPLLTRTFADVEDVSARDVERTVAWVTNQHVDRDADHVDAIDGRALDEDNPSGRFDIEDDPILLRLVQLKRGGLITRNGDEVIYSHVAIDEAQDRSAIEVKVLLEATASPDGKPSSRSVTIAGDTAQRVVFDNAFDGWQSLLEHTGHAASVIRPLKLSYRSTAEVMELAVAILGPELAPDEPLVARNGAPVELHEFGDIGEGVAFLGDALRALSSREPTASVAVIARYSELADAYYAGLKRAEVPALRRVRSQEFTFDAGVDVTDIMQVKGLEFDYVVMVDVNESSYSLAVEARHLLHIGVTRAAHQLWLVSTDRPSRLLPDSLRIGAEPSQGTSKASAPSATKPEPSQGTSKASAASAPNHEPSQSTSEASADPPDVSK